MVSIMSVVVLASTVISLRKLALFLVRVMLGLC